MRQKIQASRHPCRETTLHGDVRITATESVRGCLGCYTTTSRHRAIDTPSTLRFRVSSRASQKKCVRYLLAPHTLSFVRRRLSGSTQLLECPHLAGG